MSKRVCAIVVTYNRLEVLKTTLKCIQSQTVAPANIIIVDNNSSDGTKEFLLKICDGNNTQCLFLDRNTGYAGGIASGINYALKNLKADYFWLMDDDSHPPNNFLSVLLENIEGSEFDIISSNGAIYKHGFKKEIIPKDELQEADIVLIDGALIKSEVVQKIGVPRDKYFMMCEDYEYCKRLKKNGFKLGVLHTDTVTRLHLGGGGQFTRSTLWRGYYHSRNHMLILKEYFSVMSLIGYLITQAKFIIGAALHARDRIPRVKLRLLGIWHGIKGVEGKTLDPATLKFYNREYKNQN